MTVNHGERPQPAGAILDFDHLERQTMGDADLAREVLRLFVEQAQRVVARLAGPVGGEERSRHFHTLAGSARGIGAWQVASLASRFETAAGTELDTQPLFEALKAVEQAIMAREELSAAGASDAGGAGSGQAHSI